MAAVRPSSLILDDDDDWGAVSPLPSSATRGSAVTSSSTLSGESINYVNAGGAGGGGGRRTVMIGLRKRVFRYAWVK
jgi:hypothetical protein